MTPDRTLHRANQRRERRNHNDRGDDNYHEEESHGAGVFCQCCNGKILVQLRRWNPATDCSAALPRRRRKSCARKGVEGRQTIVSLARRQCRQTGAWDSCLILRPPESSSLQGLAEDCRRLVSRTSPVTKTGSRSMTHFPKGLRAMTLLCFICDMRARRILAPPSGRQLPKGRGLNW